MKAGVDSYIKKSCDLQEIIDAIHNTSKGVNFFCGKILEAIKKDSIEVSLLTNSQEFSCDAVELSKREKEVLCLIAEGLTNTAIADKLFLSSHTVTTHRKNIMIKLGVNNTAGIVMYAVKSGIVSPNSSYSKHPKRILIRICNVRVRITTFAPHKTTYFHDYNGIHI